MWQVIRRAFGYSSTITEPVTPPAVGAVSGVPAYPTFSAHTSMAAFAVFPWVRACTDCISQDLAGLPINIYAGQDANRKRVIDPALARLLARPTSHQSGQEWRQTLVNHLLLAGNAYILMVGLDNMPPSSLVILHPERVLVVPGRYGEPVHYEFTCQDGTRLHYAPERVIHIRLAAWEPGAQGLLGEGLIRALSVDLSAESAASKLTAKVASTGRPSAIFTPAPGEGGLSDKQQKAVADSYDKLVSDGRNAMVLPGSMAVVFPNLSPRDMEFAAQRTMTRDAVLAAFGVPPSRVGLPTANYATAQQQSLIYWSHLQSLSRLLDAAFTQIANMFNMDYDVAHDYAGVAALQEARTAQLSRVKAWVDLGADPALAAAYEGLGDGPLTKGSGRL